MPLEDRTANDKQDPPLRRHALVLNGHDGTRHDRRELRKRLVWGTLGGKVLVNRCRHHGHLGAQARIVQKVKGGKDEGGDADDRYDGQPDGDAEPMERPEASRPRFCYVYGPKMMGFVRWRWWGDGIGAAW